jgi:aspartate kinase
MTRVLKFGGAGLRDGAAVQRSAELVAREAARGRVLVVVSAQEGVTVRLAEAVQAAVRGDLEPWNGLRVRHRTVLTQLGLEGDLLDRHLFELRAILAEIGTQGRAERRMSDFVLSFGERMSARVMAAVLRRLGLSASPLDAYDLGLTTASKRGEAALLSPPTAALRRALEAVPGVAVVTGFLALDSAGHLTTLGRNGSDLSAVWFGEAVGAEEVVLWKTVDGFRTADPHVVANTRRLAALGRDEAIEFAVNGAAILHAGALEPAARANLTVRVTDVRDPDGPGTRIDDRSAVDGPLGLAHRESVALWHETLSLGRDLGEQVAEVAAQLEPERLAFQGHELCALVSDDKRVAALAESRAPRARLERGLASIAVVGRGVGEDTELAERVSAIARSHGIELAPVPGGQNPSSLAYLLPRPALATVLQALHDVLFGGAETLVPQPRPESSAART